MALLAVALSMTALRAQSEFNIPDMPTSALNTAAADLVTQREYAKAVPYLTELVRRLQEAEDQELIEQLRSTYLFLGAGHLVAGSYEEAVATFDKMIERFPDDTQTRLAVNLKADALAGMQKFEEAGAVYLELLNNFTLEPDFFADVLRKLGEVYIAGALWEKAVPVLQSQLKRAPAGNTRNVLTVNLMRCLLELNRIDEVIAILPGLDDASLRARAGLTFNTALIGAGDRAFDQKNYLDALLLYQLVVAPDTVRDLLKAELAEGERRTGQLTARGANVATLLSHRQRLRRLEAELAALDEMPQYMGKLLVRRGHVFTRLQRPFEAIWSYQTAAERHPDDEAAEEALYGAAALAGETGLIHRALTLAATYFERHPAGKFAADLAVATAKMLVIEQRYGDTLEFVSKRLDTAPDDPVVGDLLFYRGFSHFQLGNLPDAVTDLHRSMSEFPKSDSRERVHYWLAMAQLFSGQYAEARDLFNSYGTTFSGGQYTADAAYRIPCCSYALSEFDRAEEEFLAFLKTWPDSPRRGEALSLLGDLAANRGDTSAALRYYADALQLLEDPGQIAYAVFKSGEIYELLEEWTRMWDHFAAAIEKHDLGPRTAEAMWRMAFAERQRGKPRDALAIYLRAIEKFGNDPKATGVDLIFSDWFTLATELREGQPPGDEIRASREAAMAAGRTTLAMRWAMIEDQAAPGSVSPAVFSEADLQNASPAALLWIAESLQTAAPEKSRAAAERLLREFRGSQWEPPAALLLAGLMEKSGQTDQAISIYDDLAARFPTSLSTADALKRKAAILSERGENDAAITLYETMLATEEFKGAHWPLALYGIARNLEAKGDLKAAQLYYQRIYILYQNFSDWTAKAYLASGQLLERLGLSGEAAATYREMVAIDTLSSQPEFTEARNRLNAMP